MTRRIETVEALDALPAQAVVGHQESWGGYTPAQKSTDTGLWYVPGSREYIHPRALIPATLLHDPSAPVDTPASSRDTDGLRDLMQRAIDRADPPGRMRTGHESVSAALLRGMLRDAAPTPSTPGPLHWKLDSGRGAMLDERDRIVGYWTPPTALGLVVPHPEVEQLRAEVENARCTIEADKRAMDELAAERDALRADMRPGRWWRSIEPDGSVWGESSDEAEIRRMARKRHRIQRCWQTETVSEWRDA